MTLGGTWYFPSASVRENTFNVHTNYDGGHGSTAAPIAVGGHNTDSVVHIIGYSDWRQLTWTTIGFTEKLSVDFVPTEVT